MQIKTVHCLKLILLDVFCFSCNSLSFLPFDVSAPKTVNFECIFDITFITLCKRWFFWEKRKLITASFYLRKRPSRQIAYQLQNKRHDSKETLIWSCLLLQNHPRRVENITMRQWTIFDEICILKTTFLPYKRWFLEPSDFFRRSSCSIAKSIIYQTFG